MAALWIPREGIAGPCEALWRARRYMIGYVDGLHHAFLFVASGHTPIIQVDPGWDEARCEEAFGWALAMLLVGFMSWEKLARHLEMWEPFM